MADISKSRDENPVPTLRVPDQETPEAAKARLYEYHKKNGSLGIFYDLYGEEKREHRQELREALQRHIEAPGHAPVTNDLNPSRGLER